MTVSYSFVKTACRPLASSAAAAPGAGPAAGVSRALASASYSISTGAPRLACPLPNQRQVLLAVIDDATKRLLYA